MEMTIADFKLETNEDFVNSYYFKNKDKIQQIREQCLAKLKMALEDNQTHAFAVIANGAKDLNLIKYVIEQFRKDGFYANFTYDKMIGQDIVIQIQLALESPVNDISLI